MNTVLVEYKNGERRWNEFEDEDRAEVARYLLERSDVVKRWVFIYVDGTREEGTGK